MQAGPIDHSELETELRRKIADRSARLGVIGLGYVGLPLVIEMARKGFSVTGIDVDRARIEAINAGTSYILDVPSEILGALLVVGKVKATASFAVFKGLDTV